MCNKFNLLMQLDLTDPMTQTDRKLPCFTIGA
jgi:hypothetical protein